MKRFRTLGLSLLASGLLLSMFAFLAPVKVFAADGTWVWPNRITSGGVTYEDSNIYDNPLRFRAQINDNCEGTIDDFDGETVFETSAGSLASAHISISGDGCDEEIDEDITLASPELAVTLFNWVDSGRIQSVMSSVVYELNEDESTEAFLVFERTSASEVNSGCPDSVSVYTGSNGLTGAQHFVYDGCDLDEDKNVRFTMGNTDRSDDPPGTGTPNDPGDGGDGEAPEEQPHCEDAGGLAWLGCPILVGIDNGLSWIQTNVEEILYIEPARYETSGIRNAWVIFRNISTVLLIIVLLVMVLSTTIGVSFFDAYTVKKLFPRLVAGIILMQLSWAFMTFGIGLINTIGDGLFGLMLLPFGGPEATDLPSIIVGNGSQGLFNTLVVVGLGGAGVFLGFFGLLSLAFTTFLAVLIGFFVLVIRNLVIVLCLVLAPLAIVAWITPGSTKGWNLWWDSFSKALLMYPLIMMLFAAGRILAVITMDANTDTELDFGTFAGGTVGGSLEMIIVIIAYAVPFFMIPFTLKFAGGLVASLGGMANDRGRGIFDRNKKFRQAQMGKNWQDMRGGNRFKGTGRVSRGLSTGLGYASNADKLGFGVVRHPKRSFARLQGHLGNNDYEEAMEKAEKDPNVRGIVANDDYLEAGRRATDREGNVLTYTTKSGAAIKRDGSAKSTRAILQDMGYDEKSTQQVLEAKKAMSDGAFNVMAAVRIAGTGTGYGGGIQELYESVNAAAGNDRHLAARMLADTRGIAERARRPDLVASGYGQSNRLMNDLYNGTFSDDYTDQITGEIVAKKGEKATLESVGKVQALSTQRTQDPRTVMSMKAKQLGRDVAPLMSERVEKAATGGTYTVQVKDAAGNAVGYQDKNLGGEHFIKELAFVASRLDNSSGATPEQAEALRKALTSQLNVSQMTNEVRSLLSNALTEYKRDANGKVMVDPATKQPIVTGMRTQISVQDALEAVRYNRDFTSLRREYGSSREAAASGAFLPPQQPEDQQ